MDNALSSYWGSLSPHLIASFFEVDREGKRVDESITVRAPLSESNLDVIQNWQSPFENIAQSSLPTLQQMLQSGAFAPLAKLLSDKGGPDLTKLVASAEGKSSVTQLNSTQVWSGSPPLKITITAVFRAWSNPVKEVESPVDQLMRWSLPAYLEPDGLIGSVIKNGVDANSVMPSTVPSIIAFKYKNRTYSPMVIESIGYPISSPIDSTGHYVELSVPMTLCGLSSIDRGNWDSYSR